MNAAARTALSRDACIAAAVLAVFGWNAVLHFHPWTAFYNEAPFFVAVLLLAAVVVSRSGRGVAESPRALAYFSVLIIVPWLQLAVGKVLFLGDAVTATLYLASFCVACQIGYQFRRTYGDRFPDALASAVLAGALLAGVVATAQWLRVDDVFGIWAIGLGASDRPYGNLAQPNNLANLLCVGLAALLYLNARGRMRRALFLYAVCFLMLATALTRSRTALVVGSAMASWLLLWNHRLGLRLKAHEITLGFSAYIGLWFATPALSRLLYLDVAGRLDTALSGGVRWVIWRELWHAALLQPWFGFGWNQVATAQVLVAADFPHSEYVGDAHNILLDLILWNGFPIGALVAGFFAYWFTTRARRMDTADSWLAASFLLIAGTHALFEFPLSYAYFLLPAGLAIGLIEHQHVGHRTVTCPVNIQRAFVALVAALSVLVGIHYLRAESDYRAMRFANAGFVRGRDAAPTPSWSVLTQLDAFLEFARTEARRDMSDAQLRWMEGVAHRFPYPPTLFRYALALGLNGQPDAAALELRRLRQLSPAPISQEAHDNFRALSSRYPELNAVLDRLDALDDAGATGHHLPAPIAPLQSRAVANP